MLTLVSVDSCYHGQSSAPAVHCTEFYLFCLYRVERLGYPVPKFDFRLNGVTSMSADIHKYGLGPKVLVSHLTCIILVSRVYREPVLCCTDLETTGGIRYLLVLTGLEDCMALPLWAVPDQVGLSLHYCDQHHCLLQ